MVLCIRNVFVCVPPAGPRVVRPLGGRARAHGGAVEAAHLPGGGGVRRAAAAAAAPAAARPRAARAHHIGTAGAGGATRRATRCTQ